MVLQGYGVTVYLIGSTSIKNGITTSTFKATPDVPFDSFELNLPQGRFSALTANANLCSSKLTMPTEFTAQNGTVLKHSTKIVASPEAMDSDGARDSRSRAPRLASQVPSLCSVVDQHHVAQCERN